MSIFSTVKNKISILDVIGQHVTLKKAGTYWKGPCPFHSEKTASFTISPHREIFYCFGCHETGDVITFVSKIEHCTQLEAVKLLAERYSIELPDEITHASAESVDEKKRYFTLMHLITEWCQKQLLNSAHATAYLHNRSINEKDITTFNLGYFPAGQAAIKQLIQTVLKENFLLKDLIEAGVIAEGKTLYSSFENRIMFPIKDHRGNFCGFGARIFKDGDERSKYYNSPENNFFQKGSLLFGFDLAKRAIQTKESVFLVEGYTDCIAMHHHGYQNTVATLGTACTLEHLKALSYHAHTAYVLYDGDGAGQNAMLRLVELCWRVNLDMKIITLPQTMDPASFLQQNYELDEYVKTSQDIFDFVLHRLQQNYKEASLQQKLSIARHFLDIIKKLNDPLKEEILLQKASVAFGLPLTSLQKEYTQRISSKPETDKGKSLVQPLSSPSSLEKNFIHAILNNTELLRRSSIMRLLPYLEPELKKLLEKLIETSGSTETEMFQAFFETLDEREQRLVNQILTSEEADTQNNFEKIEMLLEKKYWKMIVHDTKIQIHEAEQNNDTAAVQTIVDSFLSLKKKLLHKGLI